MNVASILKVTCPILLIAVIQGCSRAPQPQEAAKPEAAAPEISKEAPMPAAPTAKGEIIIKSEDELKNIIHTGNVVVDFHGEAWCGPCQQLAPIFKKVAEDTPNVTFAKVNVDEIKRPDLRGVPTIIFYKDGNEIERKTGYLDEAALRDLIKKTFGL